MTKPAGGPPEQQKIIDELTGVVEAQAAKIEELKWFLEKCAYRKKQLTHYFTGTNEYDDICFFCGGKKGCCSSDCEYKAVMK